MLLLVARHTVREYAAGRLAYDEVKPMLREGGALEQSV
jgi:hypothetical protein